MNLLLVNYEYPPVGGGAGNATRFLGRAFVQRGHQVHILTSGLRGMAGSSEEAGLRVHRLPLERAQADRASQWEMARFLWQSHQTVPDLHQRFRFHGAIAFFTIPSGPAALRLFRQARTPYLVSLRGGDVPGHVPGLGLKHAVTGPLRRAVLRSATGIVANSESLAATSRKADPFPVRVVPNGVDSELFHPVSNEAHWRRETTLRLLFVGRIHPEKNLGAVLRELAKLPATARATMELHIVGDGAQRPELEKLGNNLGIGSQIHWLGWQDKPALPELYRSAHALVNPSHYEGMPNVVLEAMATGLPVFASDVPGNRGVIEAGKTGILFPLDRPADLGAALLRLHSDRAWGCRLGNAGRQRVVTQFGWDSAAQSYLELLGGALPSCVPS